MTTWSEQPPDFRMRPIEALLTLLSFTSACAIVLAAGGVPKVVASARVLDSIWQHLGEQRIEMGGLLIGAVHAVAGSDFIVSIEAFARGDDFNGTGVSLRLDAAVWEVAREKTPVGSSVIGWYHSHPNLGAFFSGTDRRTQSGFFGQPHCLGLVVDPVRREEKWFIGAGCRELRPSEVLRLQHA